MRITFTSGSCIVRRDPEDTSYASTDFGERRFLLRLLNSLNARRSLDWSADLVCRKATTAELKLIDAAYGLFRGRESPGQIWAIYYETARGDTAAGEFTTQGRARLAVARVQRRPRCQKR